LKRKENKRKKLSAVHSVEVRQFATSQPKPPIGRHFKLKTKIKSRPNASLNSTDDIFKKKREKRWLVVAKERGFSQISPPSVQREGE